MIKAQRIFDAARWAIPFIMAVWLFIFLPLTVAAAPYAAMVMDARSGKVLHSENANTRLHPASLTKMMTLYVAFEAVENGEISLDTMVRVSKKAAAEPPSKLGLRSGQRIKLRFLIRAAAVRSANDASTAIAEAISGSEAAFARRMNRTAKAMGMTRTTFKNAHGLTESGHLSTARDMSILGRHVIYDYPEYYNLFSRRTADAGVRRVSHTNRRLLEAYRGADGIKTGYTRAAGFNLVASAERGSERVIATVFGGRSTATRNARVAELLDLGFRKAPTRMALSKPRRPRYEGNRGLGHAGKVIVAQRPLKSSLRPLSREILVAEAAPAEDAPADTSAAVQMALASTAQIATDQTESADASLASEDTALDETALAELKDQVASAVAEAAAPSTVPDAPTAPRAILATRSIKPRSRPQHLAALTTPAAPAATTAVAPTQTAATQTAPARAASTAALTSPNPRATPSDTVLQAQVQEVITRVSTSGAQHWGVNVGRYPSHFAAEKVLLQTALMEMATLDGAVRRVVNNPRGFDANFLGLTRDTAEVACQRLQARNVTCFIIGPS